MPLHRRRSPDFIPKCPRAVHRARRRGTSLFWADEALGRTEIFQQVAITELDIRMTLPSTDALLAQQQTDYENVIKACNAVEGCIGMTIWDYTDKVYFFPPISQVTRD